MRPVGLQARNHKLFDGKPLFNIFFTIATAFVCAEGAMTCQKDVRIPKHHILDIPNLHVAKALLSLKSKGHVREVFNWCVVLCSCCGVPTPCIYRQRGRSAPRAVSRQCTSLTACFRLLHLQAVALFLPD